NLSRPRTSRLRNRWHSLLGSSNCLGWILVILQPAREVGVVGSHVKVTMPGQVEKNDLLFSRFLCFQGFVDWRTDRVASLWCGHDAFATGELHCCLEDGVLVIGLGIDDTLFMQQGYQGSHAMVAQAAGVDTRRNEIVAESMHLDQRCHAN